MKIKQEGQSKVMSAIKCVKIKCTGQKEDFFEMAAMPFLCNGILIIQCNLPRVLSVLVLKNC